MRVIQVLDADPALGEGLTEEETTAALREAVAHEVTLARGAWLPSELMHGQPGDIGLLVLEGFVGRETRLLGRSTLELLGPGDLLRPWDRVGDDHGPLQVDVAWTALGPVRIALLDRRFGRIAGQWPAMVSDLLARAAGRAQWLSLSAAAVAIPRLQERLLVLLWLAADRWGRVTPTGVLVPIRLTQAQLAAMAGARRPSVSTALTALGARGLVVREPRGAGWRLAHEVGDEIQALASACSGDAGLQPGDAVLQAVD
jgi:CRP/FNR family cyclic AMP-dependent transcriptional regulator